MGPTTNSTLRSTDFVAGDFPPHGVSEILDDGEVVFAHTTGPFNLEGVIGINRARMEYFRLHPITRPVCHLTILHRSVLMSHECIDAFNSGIQQAFGGDRPRLTALAWVPDGDVEGLTLMTNMYTESYAAVGIPLQIFDNVGQARQWFQECLKAAA